MRKILLSLGILLVLIAYLVITQTYFYDVEPIYLFYVPVLFVGTMLVHRYGTSPFSLLIEPDFLTIILATIVCLTVLDIGWSSSFFWTLAGAPLTYLGLLIYRKKNKMKE